MNVGPRIDSYEWERGREAMLRFGPDDGPLVVAALPLLEEANRTRAFVVSILRALAERGIGSSLPDLPGQGESLVPTEQMRLADLRAAFAAVVEAQGGRPVFALTIRSGALLTEVAAVRGQWSLAPQMGGEVLKEWRRLASGGLEVEQVEIAGNLIARDFLHDLAAASLHPRQGGDGGSTDHEVGPGPSNASQLDPRLRGGGASRVVRLASDPRTADWKIDGTPLWRRAEPDNDIGLAQRLAGDIADWITACES